MLGLGLLDRRWEGLGRPMMGELCVVGAAADRLDTRGKDSLGLGPCAQSGMDRGRKFWQKKRLHQRMLNSHLIGFTAWQRENS